MPNLWGHFKNGVLRACDEVYWKKRGRRSKGDTWWWNEEVKEQYQERCMQVDDIILSLRSGIKTLRINQRQQFQNQ